jgi:5-methylcytosine-specific restriction endonuclease McrA
MTRTSAGRPCTHISRNGKSCPNLRPCPEHPERPRNAPWSEGRNSTDQGRFRRATLTRDAFTCQRCGLHDPTGAKLDAHHVTPERGVTLCNAKGNGCHAAVDGSAR